MFQLYLYLSFSIFMFFHSPIISMFPKGAQLEFGPARRAYYNANKEVFSSQKDVNEPTIIKPCAFCDPEIMATNYVISEDPQTDTRIQTNKFQYPDWLQAYHLLITTISHKENHDNMSREETNNLANAVSHVSWQLYPTAYTQEHFINNGPLGGQSQCHRHSQFKSFEKPPVSMPKRMKQFEHSPITNAKDAFAILKNTLQQTELLYAAIPQHIYQPFNECPCCTVVQSNEDADNFIVKRFEHNVLCLSHYPGLPGELSVVPNQHVSAIKDLPQEAWQENMAIALALLPIIKQYAHENIRDCGGANVYTKSIGFMESEKKKSNFHIHTRVMPRTTVPLTPGWVDGNSCKLDYDPAHLLKYLVEHHANALHTKIMGETTSITDTQV